MRPIILTAQPHRSPIVSQRVLLYNSPPSSPLSFREDRRQQPYLIQVNPCFDCAFAVRRRPTLREVFQAGATLTASLDFATARSDGGLFSWREAAAGPLTVFAGKLRGVHFELLFFRATHKSLLLRAAKLGSRGFLGNLPA
ncbi:hypothetical protein SKAU_G00074890 [Synaphobranchus kaupii]|uniref:Uncharacterized protein n=1 Tax=Synaphobranchus kaupii TaxID=118154 RepID=A0A9Q1G7H1_SYNKA|nr:hypothetical protein SKAU_G00074890 [Synaphobranchus kaupii]